MSNNSDLDKIEHPTDRLTYLCKIFNRQSRNALNRDVWSAHKRNYNYPTGFFAAESLTLFWGKSGIGLKRVFFKAAETIMPFEPAKSFWDTKNQRTAIDMAELHAKVMLMGQRHPLRVAQFLPEEMKTEEFLMLSLKRDHLNLAKIIKCGMGR